MSELKPIRQLPELEEHQELVCSGWKKYVFKVDVA